MSFMAVHYECCESTTGGGGGDATAANQLAIIAALAALQTDVDDVQTGVDILEDKVCKPEAC